MQSLLLASGSAIRAELLRNAAVPFEVVKARIDEQSFRQAMQAEGVSPRDMSDHLAELKAMKAATRAPEALVLGCDQILEFDGAPLGKPSSPEEARSQMRSLSGNQHSLHTSAVLVDHGTPVWRLTNTVRLTMRKLSDRYIEDYVDRNWEQIRHCVGGYQIEAEGVRLFTRLDGDFFSVLGLPLLPLLDHLALRGVIET